MAQKLLRQPNTSASKTEIMLHRMPYAKVFAIHRSVEGQSLGLKRNGGTGEVSHLSKQVKYLVFEASEFNLINFLNL